MHYQELVFQWQAGRSRRRGPMSEPFDNGDMDAGGTHRTISFLNRWAPLRLQRCSCLLLDDKHGLDLDGLSTMA